jgi:hypothetical protein
VKVYLIRQRSRVGMVCLGLLAIWGVGFTLVFAQGRLTDVLVSVVKDKVIAVTGVGQSEIDLSVGETVRSTKAQGLTALAITSTRLLGFSSQLRRWGEQTLAGDERVTTSKVLREFCLVATDQHLYGFQETLAHWTSEDLGASERVQDVRSERYWSAKLAADSWSRSLALRAFTIVRSRYASLALAPRPLGIARGSL